MDDVKFSTECPQIYYRLRKAFNVDWKSGLIIAFYPTIHCRKELPPEKIVHEVVHLKRQKEKTPELWYDMYIQSPAFRLEEELLAHKAEIDFLTRHIKDRELLFHAKREIAHNLSSSLYGNIITPDEALNLL